MQSSMKLKQLALHIIGRMLEGVFEVCLLLELKRPIFCWTVNFLGTSSHLITL
jgi:hypothetical protein